MSTPTLSKIPLSSRAVTSNIETIQSNRMQMDQGALDHLLSLLTDMYSDPYLAIVREYSTNALDSHILAGNPDPIRISLPSILDPTFTVEDSGVGMSLDELQRYYGMYGASSKRDDMNQAGAFGIGGKSALTLVDQFTIIATKDGVKTTVLVSKDATGVGMLNILSSVEVDAPNGVKISIPIPNPDTLNARVEEFFVSWKPGTVLVDGMEPPSIYTSSDFYKYENFYFAPYSAPRFSTKSSVFVMMGSTAYPVDLVNAGVEDASNRWGMSAHISSRLPVRLYIDAPIGSIDLVGSREALRYSTRTKAYIKNSINEFITTGLRQGIQDAVDALASNGGNEQDVYDALSPWLSNGVLGESHRFHSEPLTERCVSPVIYASQLDRNHTRDEAVARIIRFKGDPVPAISHINDSTYQFTYSARQNRLYEDKPNNGLPRGIRVLSKNHMDHLAKRYLIIGTEGETKQKSVGSFRSDFRDGVINPMGPGATPLVVQFAPKVTQITPWETIDTTGNGVPTVVLTTKELNEAARAYRRSNPRANRMPSSSRGGSAAQFKYRTFTRNPDASEVICADMSVADIAATRSVVFFLQVHGRGSSNAAYSQVDPGTYAQDAYAVRGLIAHRGLPRDAMILAPTPGQSVNALKKRLRDVNPRIQILSDEEVADYLFSEEIAGMSDATVRNLYNAITTRHAISRGMAWLLVAVELINNGAKCRLLSEFVTMNKQVWNFHKYGSLSSGDVASPEWGHRLIPLSVSARLTGLLDARLSHTKQDESTSAESNQSNGMPFDMQEAAQILSKKYPMISHVIDVALAVRRDVTLRDFDKMRSDFVNYVNGMN